MVKSWNTSSSVRPAANCEMVWRIVPTVSGEALLACAFSQNRRMKSVPMFGSVLVVPSCSIM